MEIIKNELRTIQLNLIFLTILSDLVKISKHSKILIVKLTNNNEIVKHV